MNRVPEWLLSFFGRKGHPDRACPHSCEVRIVKGFGAFCFIHLWMKKEIAGLIPNEKKRRKSVQREPIVTTLQVRSRYADTAIFVFPHLFQIPPK
ncbi:hypothetical protein EDM58_17870 [Brevibacillus panacihumi]|uniref:Uncharacterized protein n=1 Tax=Brevibacillus panacihumi TaxID=497735 RepID=A0A3M8CL16_9BACL|nr:hypothetical protein EDM58_17870 [Brevibacillus panacihumi]